MAKIHIIQQDYKDDPWKVLVCCILLNQTNNLQIRPIISEFFKRWPTAESLISSDPEEIRDLIRSTGFQNLKTKRIRDFSLSWSSGNRDPFKFPGIGDYGREAWRIFVRGETNFIPKDKKLRMYVDSL